MARPLRQSTAVSVIVGPFLDATDGKTPETALTVSGIDIDLYKHGATGVSTSISATASGGSNDMVHIANGYYSLELTADNTDTAGQLRLSFNDDANMLPAWEDFEVKSANTFDSDNGSDRLQVDVVESSTAIEVDLTTAAIDAILDDPVEGSTTVRQSIRGINAALLGKASGLGTTTAVFRDLADGKDRISATVDASGNRSAVTLDLT